MSTNVSWSQSQKNLAEAKAYTLEDVKRANRAIASGNKAKEQNAVLKGKISDYKEIIGAREKQILNLNEIIDNQKQMISIGEVKYKTCIDISGNQALTIKGLEKQITDLTRKRSTQKKLFKIGIPVSVGVGALAMLLILK